MNIIFNALFKLDVQGQELTYLPAPEEKKDLQSYVIELLDKILIESDRKGFEFASDSVEVLTRINNILAVQKGNFTEYVDQARAIGQRLLDMEIRSDDRNNFKTEILKGVVVISLVQLESGNRKVIISKADYDGFLDAQTYINRTGYPLKKKIYKAFIADINEQEKVGAVSVYDTNSTFTVYWWRDFLELKKVFTDEHNTESVFNVIETKILGPIKKKHKQDYITLWNASVHYFRSKQEFSADGFINDILTAYPPEDPGLKMEDLGKIARNQFEKGKFDSRFSIVPNVISKRFKKTINLTPQIDLNLKSDIQNLEQTIMRYKEPNGGKWVMIKSDEGFEYFKDTNILS